MQEIFVFIDDSGVLHRNANDNIFVYAGYIFLSKSTKEAARNRYKKINRKIKQSIHRNDELKGCNIDNKHKRALFNAMRKEYSCHLKVDIDKIYNYILNNKNSIVRYKDYVLKRLIKTIIEKFIKNGEIDANKPIKLMISIDEQLTATDGIYDLKQSIYEELVYGIVNFDYGRNFNPILHGDCELTVSFCDSKNNYLVQASDILANRIFNSYRFNKPEWRKIKNHIYLTFP
ncbi:hypothetical protein ING2D1G_0695 [Peptoniphilus sp. ING2-D1G]|nr:hypothetical protein ING2D1G_0695 [Peptoniphilus sp. ING2-D1G]